MTCPSYSSRFFVLVLSAIDGELDVLKKQAAVCHAGKCVMHGLVPQLSIDALKRFDVGAGFHLHACIRTDRTRVMQRMLNVEPAIVTANQLVLMPDAVMYTEPSGKLAAAIPV